MSVFCVIQVRDEQRFLPGFLHHMAPHVDGIVALDDGSRDATPTILRAEPKVISILSEQRRGAPHANETANRHRLILEAARLGARWLVCADADERFEERFLRRLGREAAKGERDGRPVRMVRILNLWNRPDRYRVDGRCAPRWSARMFQIPATVSRRGAALHKPWFPPELDHAPRARLDVNLYHLKMIEHADRAARFAKFTAIDPDLTQQAVGYDHLIDESGLRLRRVRPWRRYRDLPAGQALPTAPAAPPAAGCLADADFIRRFHLDPASRPRPLAAPRPGVAGRPAPEAWAAFHGLDFHAIFERARGAR